MQVKDLVRILSDFDQDATVDIAKRSEYPSTFNAERVLWNDRTIVIECDD